MVLAVAVNIFVGQIALNFNLPLYLDSIGTVLAGVLAGPWVGAIVGYFTNLAWTLTGLFPEAVGFMPVAVIIGLLAGVFGRSEWMKEWWTAASAGLLTGLVAAVLSAPIAAYVYGTLGNAGTDTIVDIFRFLGFNILFSNYAQGTFSDPLDKAITFLLVWLIMLVIPQWLKDQFTPRATQD